MANVAGSVAVDGDEYDPANSSGIAKLFADAFSAAFADFAPGAASQVGKKSIDAMAEAIKLAIDASALSAAPPVGSVIGLRTDLPGVSYPSVGTWMALDGQVVDDPESQFNGLVLEDWNGDGRFLRGGTVAGVEQAQATLAHDHTIAHTHDIGHGHTFDLDDGAFGLATVPPGNASSGITVTGTGTPVNNFAGSSGGSSAASSGSSGGAETRPVNGSVTWIMRIK